MSQLPLKDQGLVRASGCKMTLVSVDVSRESIQEVAALIDPRTQAATEDTTAGRPIYMENAVFVDVYTQAYKAFGTDVSAHPYFPAVC